LIIAHRLSTIRNADLIVGFDKGIVSEMGTHDQLMERKGIYYQLVTSQTKDSTTVETTEKNESIKQPTQTSSETKLKQASESKPQVRSSINEKKSKTKSDHKQTEGLFHYELKLWRVQKPETLWIILGTCSQLINGAVFPGIVLLFSQIYSLFSVADSTSQMNQSLTLMGYIMGIGVLSFVVCFSLNLSFAIAGAKLTKRIRALMFESMLRQEVSFHDLSENRSSILLGQLTANAPFCKILT
jgi:ATP-binding cassette subfamily B (MDR/TAP) protein 1